MKKIKSEMSVHCDDKLLEGHCSVLNGLGSPVLEEAKHLFLIVALPFLQETRILDVYHIACFVKHHEHGKSEAAAVVQSLHQGCGLLLLFHSLALLAYP